MTIQYRDLAPMHAASTDATRYNLNGVHVGEEGTAATNGHVLAMVSGEDMSSTPLTIPISVAKDIAKAVKKDERGFELESCGSLAAKASYAGTVREFETIDGDFPNLKQVIPITEPEFTVGIGIEVLETIIKVARHYTGEKQRILEFRFNDKLSAFTVKVQGNTDGKLKIVGMPAACTD